MIGWERCTIIAHHARMAEQGDILRQWRERIGWSLERAALEVELLANARGIPRNSKKVPRTHASLSRWETGNVEIKSLGLDLLARAYGVSVDALRNPPPEDDAQPTERLEVPADQVEMVKAFLAATRRS